MVVARNIQGIDLRLETELTLGRTLCIMHRAYPCISSFPEIRSLRVQGQEKGVGSASIPVMESFIDDE